MKKSLTECAEATDGKEQMSGPGQFSEGVGKITLCKLSPRL